MSDMVLWIAALGVGGVGLLLLGVAGLAAAALRSGSRRSRGSGGGEVPQRAVAQHESTAAAARQGQTNGAAPDAGQPGGGALWAWLKACVFALIHAGAVSFVLGGLTFFEDLIRSSREIKHTGSVSFPAQLLPPGLSDMPTSWQGGQFEERTTQSLYDPRYGTPGLRERDLPPVITTEWEVVDILDEAGPAGEGLVGGYHATE